MKKLLLIVPLLHQGGSEKVCAATAKILKPYFDVQIAIFDSRDIAFDTDGIKVTDLNLPARPGKLGKVINVFRRAYRLYRLKKREQIDIAYSMGPSANLPNIFSGKRAKRWLGIMSYMDMDTPWQVKLFCKHSDKILCCSETLQQIIEEQYHCNHLYTLQGFFDIAEITELAKAKEAEIPWQDGRIIVSMGREDVVKGFWHLLKIFSIVHSALPDTKLMIIGMGDFTEYRALAKDLGIEDVVYFAGLQRNPYPYLKKSSLYFLTSYFEGFPNALVEAMALGLPAVATDCMTGPKEIFAGRYGILIPNMSPEPDMDAGNIGQDERQAAERVIALLQSKEEMERYSKLALERASVYSKEEYIRKIREWSLD